MGYYIQGPRSGKASMIVANHGGVLVDEPPEYHEIPKGQALICVVDNGMFDAAAFAYSKKELAAFQLPHDKRHKLWVLMDRELAVNLTGYKEA